MIEEITIGLFYGSDTGNTEEIAKELGKKWSLTQIELIDAAEMTIEDYSRYDYIIIGLSTWYDGDLQSDFEEFFEEFKTIDFTGKTIAMFGLGDQYGYGEYFVDSLGILGEVILENGGHIIGMWPDAEYDYSESKAIYKEGLFYGLAIDEDNEVHLTQERLEKWVSQIGVEFTNVFNQKISIWE